MPEIELQTDIIVGFPGETEAQFGNTLGMLAEKTAGNLDPDESRLLEQTLTALRFRFVQTMPRS